jgi:hypoxanthine phosphoribosyltransferase
MKFPPMITEEEIRKKVIELAGDIKRDFIGKEPVFVGILNGCFPFLADLLRHIDVTCCVDFMRLRSYGAATETSGVVEITAELQRSIVGKDVIVVEDIVDTGLTMSYLVENLKTRRPRSMKVCTLLDKPARRLIDVTLDYVGFIIPDQFVVGYGLDYDEKYRNIPYITVYEDEKPV